MAFFNVTIETIKSIEPIEGADRIQKATLEGLEFTFVVGKDLYKVGEQVLYFPIDSIIPIPLTEKLGVGGKLSGHGKNRVKTIKMKGIFSQGLVGKFSLLEPMLIAQHGEDWASKGLELKPEEITEWLGVTKYEPTEVMVKGANLRSLPCGLSVYDIEGCDRNKKIVDLLMPQVCYFSEKMEGSNFSISFDGERHWVNQRRHTIENLIGQEMHTWWKVAEELNLLELSKLLFTTYGKIATIYAECCGPGIQSNIYKLTKHTVYAFDIKLGEVFMDAEEFIKFTTLHKIQVAPSLGVMTLEAFLAPYKSIVEASHGKSLVYNGTLREGVVIKPMKEQYIDRFGRLIIKQRDPVYLAGNEN